MHGACIFAALASLLGGRQCWTLQLILLRRSTYPTAGRNILPLLLVAVHHLGEVHIECLICGRLALELILIILPHRTVETVVARRLRIGSIAAAIELIFKGQSLWELLRICLLQPWRIMRITRASRRGPTSLHLHNWCSCSLLLGCALEIIGILLLTRWQWCGIILSGTSLCTPCHSGTVLLGVAGTCGLIATLGSLRCGRILFAS